MPLQVARRGVYDQTGGFVHHQQMLIFKHHVEGHGLGFEGLALRRGAHGHGELVAQFDFGCGLLHSLAIELHRALAQQLLQVAAGKFGHQLGQGFVKPAGVQIHGHLQLAHFNGVGFFVARVCPVIGQCIGVEGCKRWIQCGQCHKPALKNKSPGSAGKE